MEWSKLKNIIILILLILNVSLLFLVLQRESQNTRAAESARIDAIAFIQSNGVALDESIVPRSMDLPLLQVSRDLEQEEQLAQALLGGPVTVEARGGQVYRYHNASGSIQFHSGGEVVAQFEPDVFPLNGRNAAEHALEILSRLNFQGEERETTLAGGSGVIVFRQLCHGVPLLDCQVTLSYSGGCLVGISTGRRLTGEPVGIPGQTISVSTALMRLYIGLKDFGDIYSRIESITPAYTLSVSLTGPSQLLPVWYVRTDTGSYQLSILDGTLTYAQTRSALSMPELDRDMNSLIDNMAGE